LALLGGWSARMSGRDPLRPVVRVTFCGALAMALTAGIGALFGAVV
jgi:VIT1/CCC1 family predicted Fe2+/Mn2+ transporter